MTLRLSVVETATEWVLLCESPLGSAVCHIPPPFSRADLDVALRDLETSIVRSSAKVVTRRAVPPDRVAHDFGQRLTEILLAGDARVIFARCRTQARQDRKTMRILLSTDGPNVSQIPWEFAVDPQVQDDYLALRLSLARSPRVSEPIPPLQVEPPLRVLGIQARPHDLPRLEADEERRHIATAFETVSSDLVDVTWLPGDGWLDISNALSRHPWHVLHFVGHGGFDSDLESGYLELSDERGNGMKVPATDIGRAIARCPQLRLVVINACESASTGTAGVFASTAAKLMNEGIPAVVAMQYEITDPAALAFAAAFYEAIARGAPVDSAVTMARETLKVTLSSLEWATPVLFLSSTETRIFQVAAAPPATPQNAGARSEPVAPSTRTQVPGGDRPHWANDLRSRLGEFLQSGDVVVHSTSPGPSGGLELPHLRRLDLSPPVGDCRTAAVGPGGLVAMACADDTLRIWSTGSRREVARCAPPVGADPLLLAWSPWRRHVATATGDGTIVLWDLEREVPQLVIRSGLATVEGLAFSANGWWMAVAGGDRIIQIYGHGGDMARRFQVADAVRPGEGWYGRPGPIGPVVFAPGDRRLVVGGGDGTVHALDVRGSIQQTWQHPSNVALIAASEGRLITGMTDGRLRLWTWDGHLVRRTGAAGATTCTALAADEAHVAVADSDRLLTVRSRNGDGQAQANLAGPAVTASFNGRTIITVSDRGIVESWESPPAGRNEGADA
jgi:hypothetical protein